MKVLSVAALGVFLGANITEGCLLVPYWRSLAPADFFAWYATNDRRLLGFFGPLTTITVLIVLATAAIAVWTRAAGRWPMAIAAGLMVVAVLMFPLYFQGVNARFAGGIIAPADLPGALARWELWHWVRTAIAGGALLAAMSSSR